MAKKERKLTEKQQEFLHHLAGEARGDIREAMRLAGYSDSVKRQEIINSLHEEIVAVAQKLMAANAVKAAVRISDLLDAPTTPGADNIIKAGKELLDRSGAIRKTEGEGTSIKADNVFILPQKDGAITDDDEE